MKKIIIRNLFATAIIVTFISSLSSCKKEPTQKESTPQAQLPDGIRTANGRLVFKDNEQFYKTMEYIDKSGEKARSAFLEQNNHISFSKAMQQLPDAYNYTPDETALMNMPPSVQTLLNRNGEVQVGNEIIWYNNGTKYYVPTGDDAQLERIKRNPALANRTSRYFLSYKPAVDGTTGGSGNITPNWIYLSNGADARHQYEFWQYYPAAGNRKYVHEVGAYTDYYYVAPNTCGQATYSYYTGCYLYIKMEWRGRRWQPAGETRNISYNINCQGSTSVARGCGIVDYWGFNVNPIATTTTNGTYTITMATFGGYTVSNSGYYPIGWSINVEGTISQQVVGDVSWNQWNNTGYPLW